MECAVAIKTKNYRENRKICYKVQIEGSYLGGGGVKISIEPDQIRDQIHSQVSVLEAPNNTQE